MHPSALLNAKNFFRAYGSNFSTGVIVEIGSQNVNGSIRDVAPPHLKYIGVDFVVGQGVDVILDDPYTLPFEDASVDIVVSSSCLEHSEMFWLVFLEVLRVLKPAGLFYIDVPTNADFHRYPVDCWRFYPDSAHALVVWARRSGYSPALLESFVTKQNFGVWNDYVAVFVCNDSHAQQHSRRGMDLPGLSYTNGQRLGSAVVSNLSLQTEDQSGWLYRLKRWHWSRVELRVMKEIAKR
jgi:SAM-dependent methyltransferase